MRTPPRAPLLTEEEPRDTPPEHFVQKVPDEGGDVYVIPMLEALFATLRARRATDPSPDAPEAATPPPRTEAPP